MHLMRKNTPFEVSYDINNQFVKNFNSCTSSLPLNEDSGFSLSIFQIVMIAVGGVVVLGIIGCVIYKIVKCCKRRDMCCEDCCDSDDD